MIKIPIGEFKLYLKSHTNSAADNCTLLATLDDGTFTAEKRCYVSESRTGSFLCIVRYKDEFQIDPTIELFAETDEDAEEIAAAIVRLKEDGEISGGYGICSYKNDKVFKDLSFNKYIVSDVKYLKSYFAQKDKDYTANAPSPQIKILDNEINPRLDEGFLSQDGNHIKMSMRFTAQSPEEGKILYLSKNGAIIGYIVLKKHYDYFWDTAYIFVDERERGQGYAAYLCRHAADYLRSQNRTLFYSHPANEESEGTAIKAGLSPCAERYLATIKIL